MGSWKGAGKEAKIRENGEQCHNQCWLLQRESKKGIEGERILDGTKDRRGRVDPLGIFFREI